MFLLLSHEDIGMVSVCVCKSSSYSYNQPVVCLTKRPQHFALSDEMAFTPNSQSAAATVASHWPPLHLRCGTFCSQSYQESNGSLHSSSSLTALFHRSLNFSSSADDCLRIWVLKSNDLRGVLRLSDGPPKDGIP